jgi:glycerophosphoryl diester phosphodiesterase
MTLILGHRGAPRAAIENTLDAFCKALEQQADGAEFDVRLARCGTPVVCHDHTLRRFTGRTTRVGASSAWALSREDLGRGQGVPSLHAVLELLKGKTVNIEIKADDGNPAQLAAAVARIVSEFTGYHREVITSSFSPEVLIALRRVAPTLRRGLLVDPAERGGRSSLGRLLQVAPAAIHPHWSEGPARISHWKRSGFDVHVWTCDQPATVVAMAQAGATSVITNVPAEARTALLGAMAAAPTAATAVR